MNESGKAQAPGPQSLMEAWMKASQEYFAGMTQVWAGQAQSGKAEAKREEGGAQKSKSRAQESLEAGMKAFKALSLAMSEPQAVESLLKGIHALPDIAVKLAQASWDGYLQTYMQWIQRLSSLGDKKGGYHFDALDKEIFNTWSEMYQNDLSGVLNIPQIGLTRGYQERAARFIDQYNIFQATLGEFLQMLSLPLEKSFKVLQDQLSEMSEKGSLPDSSKDYYRLWVKILEQHYMNLFRSPEYNETMRRTLAQLQTYLEAKQEMLADLLRGLPIPTHKEMDELYREIYELKKRLRSMERKKRSGKAARSAQ